MYKWLNLVLWSPEKCIAVHDLKCPCSAHRDCIITSSVGILPQMALWWGPPWWWRLHPEIEEKIIDSIGRGQNQLWWVLRTWLPLTGIPWWVKAPDFCEFHPKIHTVLWQSSIWHVVFFYSPLQFRLPYLPGNLSSPQPPLCDPERPLKCQRYECEMKRADVSASTPSWTPVAQGIERC